MTKHILLIATLLGFSWAMFGQKPIKAPVALNLAYNCKQNVEMLGEFKQVTEHILVKEASKALQMLPATFETVTEQILVSPEHTDKDEMQSITEQVLVKSASKQLTVFPPIFQSVNEQVLVREGYTATIHMGGVSQNVQIPPQFKTISRQILQKPATVKEIDIPAEYQTFMRKLIKTHAPQSAKAGTVSPRTYPAEYKTITKQMVKTPPSIKEMDLPAEYATIKKDVMVKKGQMSEVSVLCENELNAKLIQKLYSSLQTKGYSLPTETTLSLNFWKNLVAYQFATGLPLGALDAKTVESLVK